MKRRLLLAVAMVLLVITGDCAADEDLVAAIGLLLKGVDVGECKAQTTRTVACSVVNGTGQIDQVCSVNRLWSDAGPCRVVDCDGGFYREDDRCLPFEPSASYEVAPDPHMDNRLEFTVDSTGLQPPLVFAVQTVFKAGVEVGLPEHVGLEESSGAFSWTPTPSQSAGYDFLFRVTDSQSNSTTVIINITVTTPAICASGSSACQFLVEQWALGEAAGNVGDWYHNRDRFHTRLALSEFPQLDLMTEGYGAETAVHRGRGLKPGTDHVFLFTSLLSGRFFQEKHAVLASD